MPVTRTASVHFTCHDDNAEMDASKRSVEITLEYSDLLMPGDRSIVALMAQSMLLGMFRKDDADPEEGKVA